MFGLGAAELIILAGIGSFMLLAIVGVIVAVVASSSQRPPRD